MKRTRRIFILTIISILGLVYQINAHSETVANVTIEKVDNGLIITTLLEKRHLVHALKKEAKCSPKEMLRVCASQYLTNNIQLIINGKEVTMTKVTQELTKTDLVITYKVNYNQPINKIEVRSNYMLQYNDHSKVKVLSKLSAKNLIYSLSTRRKSIIISL